MDMHILKKYSWHKHAPAAAISAWIVMFVFFSFLSVADDSHRSVVLVVALLLVLPSLRKFARRAKARPEEGMEILRSKLGYVFMGISTGLFLFAVVFRLLYPPHSALFTIGNVPFVLFSYPLIILFNGRLDWGTWPSVVLYFVTILNLGMITTVADFVGAGFSAIFLRSKKPKASEVQVP